jgi:pyrophosphatase PpaX
MSNIIDTVLVDFDGTLIDTNDAILASWNYAFTTLGITPPSEDKLLATFGEPIVDTVERMFPNLDKDEVIKTYRDYQTGHFEEMTKIFPGMFDLVKALSERGFKLGVVTNRLKRTTHIGLEKFKIDKFMGTVIAFGDTEKSKPAPDPLFLALERLGSIPEKTIYIGDTGIDMETGRAAGVKTVLVGWAVAGAELLGADGPADYQINRPEELLMLIDSINI